MKAVLDQRQDVISDYVEVEVLTIESVSLSNQTQAKLSRAVYLAFVNI